MALGDTYATLDELKAYVGIPAGETMKDTQLDWALDSASREIEGCCERQFNKAIVVSQRMFDIVHHDAVVVDDFHTTTGLIVETGRGVSTWNALTDYRLLPRNGVVNGVSGWPYSEIESGWGSWLPYAESIRVTAQWGWGSVPTPVRQACLIIAAKNYKLADAALGVAGFGEFGVVRVRDMPEIAAKLKQYKRTGVHVG